MQLIFQRILEKLQTFQGTRTKVPYDMGGPCVSTYMISLLTGVYAMHIM